MYSSAQGETRVPEDQPPSDVVPDTANAHGEHPRQSDQHLGAAAIASPGHSSVKRLAQRWNVGRDALAGVLLFMALLLPWNFHFGTGVPNSNAGIFALLILVTMLSWGSIAATYAGYWRMFGSRFDRDRVCRVRLGLNGPYLLLVGAFIVYDVIQTVRGGGRLAGMGPGASFGLAGALLAAQPVITGRAAAGRRLAGWISQTRVVAYASLGVGALGMVFGVFWATRAASAELSGGQTVVVLFGELVAGAASLAVVAVAAQWMLQTSARLATITLGTAALAVGFIVWAMPFGGAFDAFSGIAQHTSAGGGVGYPGYLAWAAAAAILAPLTLFELWTAKPVDLGVVREAARVGLLLVALWCAGRAVIRITDLIVAISCGGSTSAYDAVALFAFDAATAVLAMWLLISRDNPGLPVALGTTLCAVLFVLTGARLVVAWTLNRGAASRIVGYDVPAVVTPAGHTLVMFDLLLVLLALGVLGATAYTSGLLATYLPKLRAMLTRPAAPAPYPPPPPGSYPEAAPTEHINVGPASPTSAPPPAENIAVSTPPPAGPPMVPSPFATPAGVVPGLPPGAYLVAPRRTNPLAIAALVSSFMLAPLGIIFGHISLSQIKRNNEDGRGLAIAGLVIGYIGTLLGIVGIAIFVVFMLMLGSAFNDLDSSISSHSSSYGSSDSTIRYASAGDCLHRSGSGYGATVDSATCGTSYATDRVVRVTTDYTDCYGSWVGTSDYPKIVLCLTTD